MSRGTLRCLVLGLVGILSLSFTNAFATTITFSGGFTNYSGLVGCSPGTPTFINGNNVTQSNCNSTKQVDLFFPRTPSVEFYVQAFGVGGFRDQEHNLLTYTPPASPQVVNNVGDPVFLGTITVANGIWLSNASLHFQIISSSPDPSFDSIAFDDEIAWILTSNSSSNTPDQNADFIYFSAYSNLGSLRVYEKTDSPTGSNLGGSGLYGKIGSIIPTRFADPFGAAFLNPSIVPALATVPEPASILLFLFGGGVLLLCRRVK